ncbi:hypothetical protein AHAS_Ahas09G0106200 [Arachis hypogaea]
MVQASPFSSLKHATSFARDLWLNNLSIQSWLNVFSAHLHIDEAGIRAIRKKVPQKIWLCVHNKYKQEAVAPNTIRYENSLSLELDITSREKFILIERKLARLWERLSRETPGETGEVVQDSMQEEDVMKDDSSEEVVSTVNNAPILTLDLNKIPEENVVF